MVFWPSSREAAVVMCGGVSLSVTAKQRWRGFLAVVGGEEERRSYLAHVTCELWQVFRLQGAAQLPWPFCSALSGVPWYLRIE